MEEINNSGYKYDHLQELGRGGFGTVYEGNDSAGNPVAVKRIATGRKKGREKAATEAVRSNFLKENIVHKHVIKVHDVRNWKKAIWIVMDFCDLGDLNDFFEDHCDKLDTKMKLNIMRQIAKGIAFLHEKNIVHRDIKPGNILLKSENNCGIVKLGDFGLSKILDPDEMTSAMSSNVGTVTFKAPEFWDRGPGDRVKYHRNVDIYAAGLTFAAMLQAKSGHSLVPKAEGSVQSTEMTMSIGLAAMTRRKNNQSEIKVFACNRHDQPLVKELKNIVEAMTCLSPEARIAAAEVDEKLDRQARELEKPQWQTSPISCIGTKTTHKPAALCYFNSNLAMNAFHWFEGPSETKIYDEKGKLSEKWEPCHTVVSMIGFEIQRQQYLLQGCMTCGVIRSYDFPHRIWKVLFRHISPRFMCKGPSETILVFDMTQKLIKQLHYMKEQFYLVKQFFAGSEGVRSLCYSENMNLAILLRGDGKAITGINLATGNIVWQHNEIRFDTSPQILNLCGVLSLRDETICIFTYNKVFVLEPSNKKILELLESTNMGVIRAAAISQNGKNLAIVHGGSPKEAEIAMFEILFQLPEANPYLPLQDIISNEESDMDDNHPAQ